MPVTRMRMRPWLEMMINSNSIPGLTWIDKEKSIFSIPWKHAARHGWEVEKDASLFKQWAIHTGKFKSGEASPDPKTWKANFRCAMNSLPDIEEVKNRSINKGQEAVRVYRMLSISKKHKEKRIRAKQSKKRRKTNKSEDIDYIDSQSPGSTDSWHNDEISSTQENMVDSTENQVGILFEQSEEGIRPDSTVDVFTPQFQVSPVHTPEYNETESIQVCQPLETLDSPYDRELMQMYLDVRGPHSNGSNESSYSCSESHWGETPSDEDYLLLRLLDCADKIHLYPLDENSCSMNINTFP